MPAVKRIALKFQSTWKTVLPWLIFVAGVAVDVSVCPSAEGDKCPGCKLCGRMMCTLCMERNTRGLPQGDEAQNPFIVGSRDFSKNGVQLHKERYHEADLDCQQSTMTQGFEKQFAGTD